MNIKESKRFGWSRSCPNCGEEIKYTTLKLLNAPEPFFYCNECNDVLIRKSDLQRVPVFQQSDPDHVDMLLALWKSILESAPPCPNGGRFEIWSNIKCPHCKYEYPYNYGFKNPAVRIFDPIVVIIDGATVLGDNISDSWITRVEISQPNQQGE